jgi:hypothetical protein
MNNSQFVKKDVYHAGNLLGMNFNAFGNLNSVGLEAVLGDLRELNGDNLQPNSHPQIDSFKPC